MIAPPTRKPPSGASDRRVLKLHHRIHHLACGLLAVALLTVAAVHNSLRCIPARASSPPETPTVRVMLIRHAESENNAVWFRHLILAKRDPLITERGRKQAERARAALSQWQPDLVLSSGLMRAM